MIPAYVNDAWEKGILQVLCDYIRIPNISPAFDPEWQAHGHIDRAMDLIENWCRSREVDGMTATRLQSAGRTPVLVLDVPAVGDATGTVLLYGHLDKQPEMAGWRESLGPWEPVRQGDVLYGRGAADDGYAVFAALTAIESVRASGGSHARCVVLIEASEESGSPDLPFYMTALADQLGSPDLVIGLDSGCATYDRLWVTNSMRGLTGGVLKVDILREGVHSGMASGVAPSSFRIVRRLLDRIEDAVTGKVLLPELHCDIPIWASDQAGHARPASLPFVDGAGPVDGDPTELALNSTWRPALSYIGVEGIPPPANAGNVLRPSTAMTLSFRLPPPVDPRRASEAIEAALTDDPPYGAHVTYTAHEHARGWAAPDVAPWLANALDESSRAAFGKPAKCASIGGTIPFMAMLGERYPDAQFCVTGVLGPNSNAHGPNEFLHIPMARGVTIAVATLLQAHAKR